MVFYHMPAINQAVVIDSSLDCELVQTIFGMGERSVRKEVWHVGLHFLMKKVVWFMRLCVSGLVYTLHNLAWSIPFGSDHVRLYHVLGIQN